jgi:hypothetical protein
VKDEDDNDKDLITKFFVPKYCMKILGCNVQAKTVNGIGFFDVTVETEVDTLFGLSNEHPRSWLLDNELKTVIRLTTLNLRKCFWRLEPIT